MKTKVLITALMVLISSVAYAQTEEIKKVAFDAAEGQQKELFDKMKAKLAGEKNTKKVTFKEALTTANQFLYNESSIDSLKLKSDPTLKNVFEALIKNPGTVFNFKTSTTDLSEIKFAKKSKKDKDGKQIEVDDTQHLLVPIYTETRTITKDGISDARYKVKSVWKVQMVKRPSNKKVEVKNEDGKTKLVKDTTKVDKAMKVTLNEITSVKIDYLTSEKETMRKAAKAAIVEWYANMPANLAKEYADQVYESVLEPIVVAPESIDIALPDTRILVVKGPKEIKINTNPYKGLTEEQILMCEDPTANLTVTPTFTIKIDDTLKNAAVAGVDYSEPVISVTLNNAQRMAKYDQANSVIANYTELLCKYVAEKNDENKANLENMFATSDALVEVSYVGKNKPKKTTAAKYLKDLRGTSLNMTTVYKNADNAFDSFEFTANQEYRSKKYSDTTEKVIYLKYDSAKKTYLIEQILVVPGTTKLAK